MTVTTIQITARDLRDTDVIVLNPGAAPAHVIREENLEITRQKYGMHYLADNFSDGVMVGRMRSTFRYADTLWVERAA